MPKLGMGEIRRKQIRRAAAGVLAKHGFDGTTIMRVAKAARVSTGMINHYYRNKLAMPVDSLEFVSEWFQSQIRRAIAGRVKGEEKLRALIHISFFDRSSDAQRGHRIWILAVAESLKSKSVAEVILARRRLFREMIGEILGELDICSNMSEAVLARLARELDAYLSGFSLHYVAGDLELSPAAVERTLLCIVASHARQSPETPPASMAGRV